METGAASAEEDQGLSMEINRDAPATAAGELHIDADPQTVFAVLSAIDQWPSWNPDVKSIRLQGPVQPGTTFRWKAGPGSITSTLQVVDPPRELAWTGTTMGIRAVHVFRLQPSEDGTLARSEESWEGLPARLLKGYSRRTLEKGIRSVLSYLKAEAERRAAAP
jgi:uncharacterized protein YndB with AHSA1/START domain